MHAQSTDRIKVIGIEVNGILIEPEDIAREMQYQPAADQHLAWKRSAQALLVRQVLLQKAHQCDLIPQQQPGLDADEALIQALLAKECMIADPDESAVRQHYETHINRYRTYPLIVVRHIVLICTDLHIESERDRLMLQAQELILQHASGKAFEDLARQHSACPTATQGGLIGPIKPGMMPINFERTLRNHPTGLVAEPIWTHAGLHLVHIDERIDGERLPFEQVREHIHTRLRQQQGHKRVANYIGEQIAAARIRNIPFSEPKS